MRPTVWLILSLVAFAARAEMYPVTAADELFFEQIKKAISKEDVKWLSEAIGYPIFLKTQNRAIKLKNKSDFTDHSALILSARFKSTVQEQSPHTLFKKWQGVMIGNGKIWFSQVGEKNGNGILWVYRIIAINAVDQ